MRELSGFLGLIGYYRIFIKSYRNIVGPLLKLLKKNYFKLENEVDKAFKELKHAMVEVLVLTLPDFNQPFHLEIDASAYGIGAVLM